MDTLQVLNFEQTKYYFHISSLEVAQSPLLYRVMVHERVLKWMNQIEGHNGPAQMQVGLYDDEDDEDAEYWKE